MGCLCSCLKDRAKALEAETELRSKPSGDSSSDAGGAGDSHNKSLAVSRSMSSPTIELKDRTAVVGYGLALAGVTIEQDAAYWEVHIEIPATVGGGNNNDGSGAGGGNNVGDDDVKEGGTQKVENDSNNNKDERAAATANVMFGIATKKDRKFYKQLEEERGEADNDNDNNDDDEESRKKRGVQFMRTVAVSDGDTVGVAVQYSDLPMVQFLLNGEPLHELAVNRFRGSVYPAVHLPVTAAADVTARLVFSERHFRQLSPHARFGPVIAARGIL